MMPTTELPDNELPHPLPPGYGREVLRTQVGSGVHGVSIEGADDRDEMGMCEEGPASVIGLRSFAQYQYRTQDEGVRSGPGDLDLVVYSLRKWTKLALAGNPTVLMPIFVPESEVVVNTDVGAGIRRHPEWFLSRQTANRFIGYMRSQREQMLGQRGKKHTNRPELVAVHGFDTKFAYHMVRLGLQGVELLSTGKITLPIPEPSRSWLRSMREGLVSKQAALDASYVLQEELMRLRDTSKLPEHPNYDAADRWLVGVYRREWLHSRPGVSYREETRDAQD